MNIALAAAAGFDRVFEIGVARGSFRDARGCFGGKRRAAKVCVQDHAGGVDYADQRRRKLRFHFGDDPYFELGGIR